MMDAATLSNVLSWSLQVAAITAVAALLPRLLHVDAPAIRHGWWRAVLLSCLVLPFVQPWQVLSTFPIDAPPLDMTPTLTGSGTGRLNASRSASLLSQGWERTLPAAVGVVLVAGALVRLSWLSAGLIRLRRLRAAGSPADITEGHRELTALTQAGAEIRYVPVIGQPVTFGVRHPVVLLPESLQALPDQIQRAVLAHELWHVRRRDWLWILAEETIRAVLWFHPAIWYLVSRVQSSREEVVDELTVLLTNARRTYIEALLAFADEPPLFAAAPFARRRHLFQRMLLISREAVMSSRRIVASTAAMAIAVLLTGWYGVAAFPLAAARSETSGTSVPAAALTQGARQAPPRDLKPGQAAPPTNREIELQKAVDAGTVKTVEEYVVLARMQEQRGALAEAEATLLSARRVANPETKALPPLAGFYQRTDQFDKAIASSRNWRPPIRRIPRCTRPWRPSTGRRRSRITRYRRGRRPSTSRPVSPRPIARCPTIPTTRRR